MLAERVSADLVGLKCEVDPAPAVLRTRNRRGVSDADETVAAALRQGFDPWPYSHRVYTSRSLIDSTDEACAFVRPHPTPAALLLRRGRLAPG